jgi:diaminopropionate ammonia-lyase
MPVRTIKAAVNNLCHVRSGKIEKPAEYSIAVQKMVRNFHRLWPSYKPTPLVSWEKYAARLGLKNILIKDESYRFGLKAFKILGGSYAIGRILGNELTPKSDSLSYNFLKSEEVKEKLGDLTFCTATDGNHGRGVAFAANRLGFKAVIFLPAKTVESRIEAIRQTGAEVVITDVNYDETAVIATGEAEKNDWILVQDAARPGYTEIPLWIMQGYLTMLDEITEQIEKSGFEKPSHLFLQAGVGSMAASLLGGVINIYGNDYPKTIIMEPDRAACFFESFVNGGDEFITAGGDLETIMAGLACGVPSISAWKIIRDFADIAVACDDNASIDGMRIFARPPEGDKKIISGESGSVGMGLLSALMQDSKFADVHDLIALNEKSVVLLINTEGDTDPVNYSNIVG